MSREQKAGLTEVYKYKSAPQRNTVSRGHTHRLAAQSSCARVTIFSARSRQTTPHHSSHRLASVKL